MISSSITHHSLFHNISIIIIQSIALRSIVFLSTILPSTKLHPSSTVLRQTVLQSTVSTNSSYMLYSIPSCFFFSPALFIPFSPSPIPLFHPSPFSTYLVLQNILNIKSGVISNHFVISHVINDHLTPWHHLLGNIKREAKRSVSHYRGYWGPSWSNTTESVV